MSKVLVINCSTREGVNTAPILDEFIEGINPLCLTGFIDEAGICPVNIPTASHSICSNMDVFCSV